MDVNTYTLSLIVLNLSTILLSHPFTITAQPQITPTFKCRGKNVTCDALAGYVPTENTTLGHIQSLFQVKNFSSLLRANFLPFSTPENYSIFPFQTVRIPFNCRCNYGMGLSDGLPVYTVSKSEAGNGLAYIANVVFKSLTTTQKIAVVNHINTSSDGTVSEGQKLWIPLPCSCDKVSREVVHYAHVMEFESSLDVVASEFGVDLETLQEINSLNSSDDESQVIDVPLEPSAATYSQADGAAMKSLASALTPLPVGWSGFSFCMWIGVICNNNGFVKSINLVSLNLGGNLSSTLNSLSQLNAIYLQNNQLSGPLPSFNITSLKEMYLDSNNFTSVPDGAFSGVPDLKILSLEDNLSLSPWPIPAELAELPNLVAFYASNANLIGPIPSIFSSLTSLRDLRLSFNNLSGSLPESFHGNQIENLWLNNQIKGLSGTLDILEGMTSLKLVWLQGNNFAGPIPNLSHCTNLSDLLLSSNLLTGFVPLSLRSLPSLSNISLNNNKLQGPFPDFLANISENLGTGNLFCKEVAGDCDPQVATLLEVAGALGYPLKLADAWSGNDSCNKWKFVTCDASGHITAIILSRQGFMGTISPAFESLIYLNRLDLDYNNLTGTIPDNLTTLPLLDEIDVSYNDLRGEVPRFLSSVTVLTSGNRNINPAPSSSNGTMPNTTSATKKSSRNMGKILSAVFVPLVSIVGLLVLVFIYKKKRREAIDQDLEQLGNSHLAPDSLMRFTYKTLKLATNNFDMQKKLGDGGFGSVFEGSLSEGTKVAVKRLDHFGQGRKEFLAEVRTIGSIHHVHLVKLLGFCAEDSHRLLVYEHMSKGSLDKWVFDENLRDTFNWNTKKRIVLHIAKGLAYLHEECHKRIAHLDVKPQNVLLDDEFNAKISDFGLAKLIDRDQNYVMTQMRGTRGYLAPEWLGRKITERADVYSYGVVVLEVIFGKKNLDSSHPEESTLIMQVRKKAEDNLLLDLFDIFSEDTHQNFEDVEKTMRLAIRCLHSEPARRPAMSTVVKVLEGVMILSDADDCSGTSLAMTEISDSFLSGPR